MEEHDTKRSTAGDGGKRSVKSNHVKDTGNNQKGALTIEAMLVLPLYLLVITFVINFLNISYLQLTIQQGLNNAGKTLAQYCYAVDLTVGMDRLSETGLDAKAEKVGNVISETKDMMNSLGDVFSSFSFGKLKKLISKGKEFGASVKETKEALESITGEEVVSYLLTTATDVGTSMLVEALVEEYLTEMKVNRNMLDGDISYMACLGEDNDIVLIATYRYQSGLFSMFFDGIDMRQTVVVHPWVGGKTESVREKGALLK